MPKKQGLTIQFVFRLLENHFSFHYNVVLTVMTQLLLIFPATVLFIPAKYTNTLNILNYTAKLHNI